MVNGVPISGSTGTAGTSGTSGSSGLSNWTGTTWQADSAIVSGIDDSRWIQRTTTDYEKHKTSNLRYEDQT